MEVVFATVLSAEEGITAQGRRGRLSYPRSATGRKRRDGDVWGQSTLGRFVHAQSPDVGAGPNYSRKCVEASGAGSEASTASRSQQKGMGQPGQVTMLALRLKSDSECQAA